MTTQAAAVARDHNMTLLIVDDEQANIRVLKRVLEGAGYQGIHSTTEPTEARSLYVELKPDLILLDLHMPKLDGYGVMEELSRLIAPDDYVPILVLTADPTQKAKRKALSGGAKDFLTKPFDRAEVLARVKNLLDARSLHVQLRDYNEVLEEKVRDRTAELWQAIGRLEKSESDLRLAQEETIHRLSLAAEFRDDETSQHIERMSRYCAILGERVGLDPHHRDLLRIASKMHDIGKIGIPDAILLKPGQFTPEEFEIMKQHADIGYRILHGSKSEVASLGATIAWTHHERVDGSGYPRGLTGERIPLEGRVAAVADVFDALTTNRVYRKAFTLPETISMMLDGRGSHFDGDILDLFLDSLDLALAAKEEFDQVS